MIKLYPDGRFSGLLADGGARGGRRGRGHGPVRGLHPAATPTGRCCSSAAARAWPRSWRCCARWPRRASSGRRVYYYGARTEQDLFHLEELHELEQQLPNFTFVPALSDVGEDVEWDGERGLITDVVIAAEKDLGEMDAYLCGPPPMVDAAIEMLDANGVPEDRVYYDKFTTTALSSAERERATDGN